MNAPHASPWAPPDVRQRAREAGRRAKRAAVLHTAARLFNEHGFHATSLDEVAERLHVTKPTLYRYVNSKDDILFECVREGLQSMRDGVAATRSAGGSVLEQLVAGMRAYVGIVTADFGQCVIRIGEDPLPAPRRAQLRRLKREIDLEFRCLIEQGVAEGVLRPCDPRIAAFTLAGALSWIGRWYRRDGTLSPDQVAAACTELLLHGVLADRPPAARPPPRRARTASSTTTRGDTR
jgi:AcrR family transcriptional regulator